MKKVSFIIYVLIYFSIIAVILMIVAGLIYRDLKLTQKAGLSLINDIINNKPTNFDLNYKLWQKQIAKNKKIVNNIEPLIKFLPLKYQALIDQSITLLNLAFEFNHYLPDFVGKNGQKVYYLILHNNLELRPSGGFMGSYAKVKFNNGAMEDILVQDIYVPDGQLQGHVDPPWPIQAAFGQGWWKLRDSNWEPDFPTAAKQIDWFFTKGGEEKSNGIMAINLLAVKDLIRIFEPLNVPDYDLPITADTLYQTAQNEAEKDFFPGSTQKRDFLSALSKQLIFSLKDLKPNQAGQLIKLVYKNLQNKQILISVDNNNLATWFNQLNWDGALKKNYQDGDGLISDYLYLVDTNLGANKANCCIERQVKQNIELKNNSLKEKILISYLNNSREENSRPPFFWGGHYINFLRVVLPQEVKINSVKINNQEVNQNQIDTKIYEAWHLKSIGFFVKVPAPSQALVEIDYQKELQFLSLKQYYLAIQKQPGIENYAHFIKFTSATKSEVLEKNITSDEIVKITLN